MAISKILITDNRIEKKTPTGSFFIAIFVLGHIAFSPPILKIMS